ncbi:cadherin domain-containing protein [Maricaulis parjimensis]|uniref:cadherin domain-containing protein n=1 Tax=Maricaulis parjimensis TaxID=144023 RepID=UPI001939ED14|nr:M10 family metallopeptidase C-terminal domain-containing protein [Maricaulis parjimensis]
MTIQKKTDRRNASSTALLGGAMALGGMAFMAGQAQAQGGGIPDGYSAANDQPNVSSVERLADGGARVTLSDGRVIDFAASDVAIVDGYVYIADSALAGADFAIAGAAGGAGGGAMLGGLGALGLLGAAAGGGGGGSTPTPTPTPNSAPVFTSATTASVDENTAGTVYTATATDADNNTLSYSIVGGADQSAFSINSSTGAVTFNTTPDFENPADANSDNAYEVTIRVSDGTTSVDQTVTITVDDVNEAPALTSGTTASQEEGATGVVYTVTATDPEGDPLTYSLSGDDAAQFTIDANTGEVSFAATPDFDAPTDANSDNVYDITVTASDGTNSTSQSVSITVTELNEFAPEMGPAQISIDHQEGTDWVDSFDPPETDGDGTEITYTIIGGADASLFAYDNFSDRLVFIDTPDFESPGDANSDNVYEVIIQGSDGELTDQQTVLITVTDRNDAPVLTSNTTFSVAENSTVAANLTATDPENDSLTWSINSSLDSALFTIDANTGQLSFVTPPDFENPSDSDSDNEYFVSVTVTDGTSNISTPVIITVTNVNEFAPAFTSDMTVNVAENTTGVAYTAVATDGDNDTLTYSIVGGSDASDFTIDAATGEVRFAALPDFENPADANSDNIYDIVIRASDGSQTTDINVALTVTDQAETGAPTFQSAPTGNVSENQTSAYVISAIDGEGDDITYSISGTDAGLFTVDSETGEVSFLTAPDFETPSDSGGNNVYDITVTASDGTNSNSQDVAITVSDITDEAGDVPNNNTTQVHMVSGGSYVGNLETPGDEDWIRIELVEGQRYQFDLTGTGSEPVEDTYIRLYDSAGNLIAENDDIDLGVVRDSRLGYTAGETGTYYIEVDSWDGGSDDERTGEYTLDVSHTDPLRNYSYQEIADYLRSGFGGAQFNASSGDTITVNITALTADGQTLARAALQVWSDVTGLIFQEVATDGAQITFDDDEEGAFAGPNGTSGGFITSASVNVGTEWLDTYGTTLDTYSFQTYIHEIGHALGLGHAGPYDGSADYGIDNIYLNDSWQATVMSYFSQNENTEISASTAFVAGLQVADIIAARDMYGLSTTTRSGDTTYGFNSNAGRTVYDATNGFSNATSFTIFDAGGTDTFDYSGTSATQTIDLREEAFSSVLGLTGNVGIANGTVIENAIGGSGNDTLIGNDADNVLTGNAGNDRFFASGGTDTFDGGAGTDTAYFSGASSDYTVTTSGGSTFVTDNRAGSPDGTVELIGVENIVYDADDTFPEFFGDAGPQSSGEPLDLSKLPAAGTDYPVMSPLTQDVVTHAVQSAAGAKSDRPVMESLSENDHTDLSLMLIKHSEEDGTLPHLDQEVLDAVVRMDAVSVEQIAWNRADLPGLVSLSQAGDALPGQPADMPQHAGIWYDGSLVDDESLVFVAPSIDDTWS